MAIPSALRRRSSSSSALSSAACGGGGGLSGSAAAAAPSPQQTPFDCNICLDLPSDPVVTACGHLFCWACLYKWMRLHSEAPRCPCCKATVSRAKITPIYGRGAPRPVSPALPPRPAPPRDEAPVQMAWHPHAAFGRVNAAYAGTYGLFPSLFGLQVAYNHVGGEHREGGAGGGLQGREVPDLTPQLTPEEETQEQVVRVFLALAFFIVCTVSFF